MVFVIVSTPYQRSGNERPEGCLVVFVVFAGDLGILRQSIESLAST